MIPASVQQAYRDQSVLADLLLADLDQLFSARDKKWYFTSRKKSLESFSQKVEAGVRDFRQLEDFVGAMLVVPMLSDLHDAFDFVDGFFDCRYRRPKLDAETKKSASDFPFDDVRLYGHLRVADDLPQRPIDSVIFEIQLKTFLQHAWSISTHDLVYKFDKASWARSRVAYQLKAILEHADLSVSSIASLEASDHLPAVGEPESTLQQLIEFVNSEWSLDVLPRDRRRLVINLNQLCSALRIPDSQALKDLVQQGKADGAGEHPAGLSPYQCVVEYASVHMPDKLRSALTRKSNVAIFVTPEVLQRIRLDSEAAKNALL